MGVVLKEGAFVPITLACKLNKANMLSEKIVIKKVYNSREKLSLCGHLFTGICISALSKRHEKLRPPMFAAPAADASVCSGRYCK